MGNFGYNKSRYRTLKNITYYILFAVWYIVSCLPLCILHIFSSLAAVLLFHVIRYRRLIVHDNIKSSFPELSHEERYKIEREFYTHFCDLTVESIKFFSISKSEIMRRVKFKGLEQVKEGCEKGRSFGLFLGHYGNWEWISSIQLWMNGSCQCSQLYHPLENYVTDRLILYTRKRFGGINIAVDEAFKHIVKLQHQVKSLGVGFIADQTPFWNNIYFWSNFLHHETPWFTGAERIVRKLDMDVYYLDVRRIKRGYYEAECKLITPNPKECEQFWITEQYAKLLEETIRRNPPYWLWSHRRWKRTKEEWLKITNGGIKPKL